MGEWSAYAPADYYLRQGNYLLWELANPVLPVHPHEPGLQICATADHNGTDFCASSEPTDNSGSFQFQLERRFSALIAAMAWCFAQPAVFPLLFPDCDLSDAVLSPELAECPPRWMRSDPSPNVVRKWRRKDYGGSRLDRCSVATTVRVSICTLKNGSRRRAVQAGRRRGIKAGQVLRSTFAEASTRNTLRVGEGKGGRRAERRKVGRGAEERGSLRREWR